MADIELGEDVVAGMQIIISVSEIDGEFWSSVDLHMPDGDEIDTTQFLVLLKGIEIAHEKIHEVLEQLGEADELDDEDDEYDGE
jgi:hypothetical protein